MRQVLYTTIFILLLAPVLNAQESSSRSPSPGEADSGVTISSIRFSGLKRTKEKTALRIIHPVEPGSPFNAETEELLIQKLRETGIFNPEITIETSVKEGLADIEIFVRDRWTLIPVPIFSIDQTGDWRAGILGIESNLLGWNKTVGLGFFFGSKGWSFLNFYSDSSFFGSDLEFTSSINLGLNETVDEDSDENLLRTYESDEIRFGLLLSYPLTEGLSVSAGWGYDRSTTRNSPVPDLNSTGLAAGIEWEEIYYDIPYEYGLSARAGYGWNLGLGETENYQRVTSRISWGLKPFGRQLLQLRADAGWIDRAPVQNQFRLGGRPGTLTLPMGKIGAEDYASASLIWNTPLWSFRGGTLSARAFYEGGYYSSDLIDPVLFHGPGAGLELYINNLAIPAIQMNIAWNLETGVYQFSAGVGMGGNPD